MSWHWDPVWLEGLFKLSGGGRPKKPVVHTFDLKITYKDGSERTDPILSGFRKRKNARRAAQEAMERRKRGSEADEIENITYKLRNVYIQDWL